jgi:hypothetical protein
MTRRSKRRTRSNRTHSKRTRSRRTRSRRMKGGFVKQDIVNFGRHLGFGAQSAYRGLLGMNPPTNPNPLIQPIKVK